MKPPETRGTPRSWPRPGDVPSALSDHAPVFADLAWDDKALPPRVALDNRSAAQTSVPAAARQTSIPRGDRSGLGAAGWFGGGGGFV